MAETVQQTLRLCTSRSFKRERKREKELKLNLTYNLPGGMWESPKSDTGCASQIFFTYLPGV